MRKKKRLNPTMSLLLNSLVDMLTILLVFLLKSYSASPELNVTLPGLEIPTSHSDKDPETTLTIIVTQNSINIEKKTLAQIKDWEIVGIAKEELLIPELYNYLKNEAENQKYLASLRGREFEGKISLIADKRMPFYLLKKIMYTAGQAEFAIFKFATFREES